MTDNKPVSLGEQPHDPTHCHRGGRPHLGPCIEPPDGKLIAELAAVMHTANDGATCTCDIREEFEVSAEATVKFLIEQKRLVPDGDEVRDERDRLATYVEEHQQRVLNGHTTPGEPDTISQVFIDVDTADPETLRKEVRRLDHRLRWMHDHYDDDATVSMITLYKLAKQRDEVRTERNRLADIIQQYEPVIEAAKAWHAAGWNTRTGDPANALSDTIAALEEGSLKLHPIDPLRPGDMNYLIDPTAEAELNRLRAALRLCEHVLHRAQPCDAMMHAAQQAAGAHSTDWTLADVADDLAPDTVLDVDDPEIDWNEVRWND